MPSRATSVDGARKSGSPMLSRRALNRALLARQWLLRRSDRTVLDAVSHLVGLQAQTPNAPYLLRIPGLRLFNLRMTGSDPLRAGHQPML
jgi:hypothetical protein